MFVFYNTARIVLIKILVKCICAYAFMEFIGIYHGLMAGFFIDIFDIYCPDKCWFFRRMIDWKQSLAENNWLKKFFIGNIDFAVSLNNFWFITVLGQRKIIFDKKNICGPGGRFLEFFNSITLCCCFFIRSWVH